MNKIKRIYQHELFPYFLFASIYFVYHLFTKINVGDDIEYFCKILDQYSVGDYLSMRYHIWTSRLVIETAIIYLTHINAWVWKLLDIGCFLLVYYCFSYFFDFKNIKFKNWLIFALVILYSFTDMSSAGWIATTLNYIWPFSFGLYILTAIKKYKNNIKIKWYEYILYTLATVYAANEEQMNVVLFCALLMCGIYFGVNKKPAVFLWFLEAITIAELIFILTCPGNAARAVAEVHWMPDYPMLSLVDKVYLAFAETVNVFLQSNNYIFIIFCSILCFCMFLKTKNIWHRFVAAIPVCIILVHSFLGISPGSGRLGIFADRAVAIDASNYFNLSLYVPIIIYILLIACIMLSIFVLYDLTLDFLINIIVLGIGLATRIIMGFSPTLYASSNRTFIYLYMAFIFCTIFMVYKFEEKFTESNKNVLIIGMGIPVISSILNILRFIR